MRAPTIPCPRDPQREAQPGAPAHRGAAVDGEPRGGGRDSRGDRAVPARHRATAVPGRPGGQPVATGGALRGRGTRLSGTLTLGRPRALGQLVALAEEAGRGKRPALAGLLVVVRRVVPRAMVV